MDWTAGELDVLRVIDGIIKDGKLAAVPAIARAADLPVDEVRSLIARFKKAGLIGTRNTFALMVDQVTDTGDGLIR